jgi:hypothetical protein
MRRAVNGCIEIPEKDREASMDRKRIAFVRCVFLPAGRSGYRPFVIRFPGGEELRGSVSTEYCYDREGRRLDDNESSTQEIEGFVPGMNIGLESTGERRMYLPDGDVYLVNDDQIEPIRLTKGTSSVSVKP